MSLITNKVIYNTEENSKINRKIDIYNPEMEEETNIKKKNINLQTNTRDMTTERRQLDSKNEQRNENSLDTNVDMNSIEGEENIDIKIIHNFKNHVSELKFLYNSKADTTISKEIKQSKILENQKNFYEDEKKKEEEEEEKKKEEKEEKKEEKEEKKEEKKEIKKNIKNNIDINIDNIYDIDIDEIPKDNIIINHINELDYNNNIFKSMMDSEEYKKIYFNEIMMFKDKEFKKNYNLNQKNDIYRTTVFYNKKESTLLINKEFLYILEIKSNNNLNDDNTINLKNENNPDLSLLYQLEKDEKKLNINNPNFKKLKIDYELSHPLVCINFNLVSCKLLLKKDINNSNNNNNYEIQIKILGSKKTILFYIKSYEIYKKFSYIIGQKIYNSEGYQMNKMGLCLRNNEFYKNIYITTNEFENIAQTGDMLLFVTLDCISDVQRVFTRDQYDHIALVVMRDGELEILEATSNEKCSLLKWRRFKFYFFNLIFKKIVLRKLNIEEKDPIKEKEIRDNINERTKTFIDKIYKKEYDMSLLKMAFSRKPEQYEIDGEWEKGNGYCCSALNAAFYVYNGIMKLEKSVHSVRPGDFEQDKNRLTMMPGFSFGPEKIIEFST